MPNFVLITVFIILSAYFTLSAGVFFFRFLCADDDDDERVFFFLASFFHSSCLAFCSVMFDSYLEGFL